MAPPTPDAPLAALIAARTARVGVIGLGYVGLPLAITTARAGFPVTGYDVDPAKITAIAASDSYIEAVPQAVLAAEVAAGRFTATTDFTSLGRCDVIVICVPTPLTRHREPDLSFVTRTCDGIAASLRPGQLDRAGMHHLSRHHRRPGADRSFEATGLKLGHRFLPRLLARTRRPRQPRLRHLHHPQGRRRRRSRGRR